MHTKCCTVVLFCSSNTVSGYIRKLQFAITKISELITCLMSVFYVGIFRYFNKLSVWHHFALLQQCPVPVTILFVSGMLILKLRKCHFGRSDFQHQNLKIDYCFSFDYFYKILLFFSREDSVYCGGLILGQLFSRQCILLLENTVACVCNHVLTASFVFEFTDLCGLTDLLYTLCQLC